MTEGYSQATSLIYNQDGKPNTQLTLIFLLFISYLFIYFNKNDLNSDDLI